jgi:hypothetical protein
VNIGETSGQIIEFIMSKTKKEGKEFTDDCIAVLTLCCSEIIKSSFCSSHYQHAIEEIVKQIKEDLK